MKRIHFALPLILLCLGLMLLAGCEGCYSAGATNAKAAEIQKEAVAPRLEQFSKAHPEQQELVTRILDGWDARPERENYELASPLLVQLAIERPESSESINRTLRTWRERLDAFGQ